VFGFNSVWVIARNLYLNEYLLTITCTN